MHYSSNLVSIALQWLANGQGLEDLAQCKWLEGLTNPFFCASLGKIFKNKFRLKVRFKKRLQKLDYPYPLHYGEDRRITKLVPTLSLSAKRSLSLEPCAVHEGFSLFISQRLNFLNPWKFWWVRIKSCIFVRRGDREMLRIEIYHEPHIKLYEPKEAHVMSIGCDFEQKM